jgi:hypothetical protein
MVERVGRRALVEDLRRKFMMSSRLWLVRN